MSQTNPLTRRGGSNCCSNPDQFLSLSFSLGRDAVEGAAERSEFYDPWPSHWRSLVAKAVNLPRIDEPFEQ